MDEVNAGAWGAIAVVAAQLEFDTIAVALVSALLLWRWRIDPIWLIFGAGITGLVRL